MSETYIFDRVAFDRVANECMKTTTSHFGTNINSGDKIAFVGLHRNKNDIVFTIAHENDVKTLFEQYEYERTTKSIHIFRRKE